MKNNWFIIIKIACVIPVIADGLFVWLQMLFSYTLSLQDYLFIFIIPFIFRNTGIFYFMTNKLQIWNKLSYILYILIVLNAVFIVINIKSTFIEIDNFVYYFNHFQSINNASIICIFMPFCIRLICFFYFVYDILLTDINKKQYSDPRKS